jgi:hypothetical protein
MKYRVRTAFLAVHKQNGGKSEFVTLEPGQMFTVRGREPSGFLKVMYRGRMVAVFERDIQERAVRIGPRSQ